jgi:hypothetical protein
MEIRNKYLIEAINYSRNVHRFRSGAGIRKKNILIGSRRKSLHTLEAMISGMLLRDWNKAPHVIRQGLSK